MNKKIISALVIILFISAAAVFFFLSRQSLPLKKQSSPDASSSAVSKNEQEIVDYKPLLEKGDNKEAFTILEELIKKNPDNVDYNFDAARTALLLNKDKEATHYMLRAWQLGKKDLDFFVLLLNRARIAPQDKLNLFDKLYGELEETPELLDLKARFYSRYNKNTEALAIWKKLCQSSPKEPVILRYARKLEMLGRRKEALEVLKKYWEAGDLGPRGFNLYFSLLVFANRYDDAALLLFEKSPVLDNPEILFKRALFALTNGKPQKCIPVLQQLIKPSDKDLTGLAIAHRARMQLALQRTILEGSNARYEDLEALATHQSSVLPQEAIVTPVLGVKASPRLIDGEKLLYTFFRSLNNNDSRQFELLDTLKELFPDNTVVQYLLLRQDIVDKRPGDAITFFSSLAKIPPLVQLEGTNGLIYKSPLFQLELARALMLQKDNAGALALISSLHQRNVYTRDSLAMFQQLTAAVNDPANQWKEQQIMMEQFNDDTAVLEQGIALARSQGRVDDALAIIDKLEPKVGQKEKQDLDMTRLMLMLEANRIDEVLQLVDGSTLSPRAKNLILARAYARAGRLQLAEENFVKALDRDNDFFGYLDYARFLLAENRPDEAGNLYREILAQNPEHLPSLLGMSLVYEEKNDFPSAIAYLETAVRVREDFFPGYLRLAKLYLMAGRLESGLQACNKALTLQLDNTAARFLKILILVRMADTTRDNRELRQHQLKEVEQLAAKYLIDTPRDPMLLNAQLSVKYAQGKREDELEIIKKIVAETGWTPPLVRRQLDLLFELNRDKAASDFLKQQQQLLTKKEAADYTALLLIHRGQISEGIALLAPFAAKDTEVAYNLAVQVMAGGSDDTMAAVLKGLHLTGADFLRLGAQALDRGRDRLARMIYRMGTERYPDNSLLLNNLAWQLSLLPDADQQQALAMAQKAYTLDDKNTAILDTYSRLLLRNKKYQECIDLLHTKIPDSRLAPELLERLATAQEALHDFDVTIDTYDRLLSMDEQIFNADLQRRNLSPEEFDRLGTAALKRGKEKLAAAIYRLGTDKYNNNSQLLFKFAATGSQLPDFDQQIALDAAAKAYALDGGNPEVITTYATLLLKNGKNQECIRLFREKVPEKTATPALLELLARAYEAVDNRQAALKTYERMLAMDDAAWTGSHLSRKDIAARKKRLEKAIGGKK